MHLLGKTAIALVTAVSAMASVASQAREVQLSCDVKVLTGEIGSSLQQFGGVRTWRLAFDEEAGTARMVEFVPVNIPPVHEVGDDVVITADTISFCLADAGCNNMDIDRLSIDRRTAELRWSYFLDNGRDITSHLTAGKCKPYVEPKQQF
jgi:hypothetical protein